LLFHLHCFCIFYNGFMRSRKDQFRIRKKIFKPKIWKTRKRTSHAKKWGNVCWGPYLKATKINDFCGFIWRPNF
jgi:hypothetical protein